MMFTLKLSVSIDNLTNRQCRAVATQSFFVPSSHGYLQNEFMSNNFGRFSVEFLLAEAHLQRHFVMNESMSMRQVST